MKWVNSTLQQSFVLLYYFSIKYNFRGIAAQLNHRFTCPLMVMAHMTGALQLCPESQQSPVHLSLGAHLIQKYKGKL